MLDDRYFRFRCNYNFTVYVHHTVNIAVSRHIKSPYLYLQAPHPILQELMIDEMDAKTLQQVLRDQ